MKISATRTPVAELDTDALILAIPEDTDKVSPWEAIDAAGGGVVTASLEGPGFFGKPGTSLALSTASGPTKEIVLAGLGKPADLDLDGWRRAIATGFKTARRRGNRRIAVAVAGLAGLESDALAAAGAEAVILADYRYEEYKPAPPEQAVVDEVVIASAADVEAAVSRACTIAEAACWARDLVNTPSNAKRPADLSERAVEMAAARDLRCEVIDTAKARELGLNALLAVGDGSAVGPRLVILEHRPEGVEGPPTAIVGKGITFDTGGISLKPPASMADMKGDMSGAAAVFGTMRALSDLEVPRWVIGVTPLAENMPSAAAYRPSDIIRTYDGTTIEVLNTDAEGRVVLADALAYTRKHFGPRCIVDLATLTGACVVALGSHAAGLMGNDDELCAALTAAGEATGERIWRLPTWQPYDKMVDSEIANVRNSAGRDAGVITAAKFLQRFVGDTPWAHLDIAGTAFLSKPTPYQPKGGTGFGVRLLVDWLST